MTFTGKEMLRNNLNEFGNLEFQTKIVTAKLHMNFSKTKYSHIEINKSQMVLLKKKFLK